MAIISSFSFLGSNDPIITCWFMLNRRTCITGFISFCHSFSCFIFKFRWRALVTAAAIVQNPFRFRHWARSVVVVVEPNTTISSSSSNNYGSCRPHPAIISRQFPASVLPLTPKTTTARNPTRSSTDQVRLLNRKQLTSFFSLAFFNFGWPIPFTVRDSPPIRKASLDRILSPQVSRRSPPYTSSPAQTGGLSLPIRDKSLSPVVAVPLSTSMSNASIQSAHSTYSEDSLIAGQHQRFSNHPNCQQCVASEFTSATPVVQFRNNNINYDGHNSGKENKTSTQTKTEIKRE